ncbi:MAG: cisplatin damage response ATP-dependent DNA ligase, partial [Alphaproteobacteria bacterium]
MRRFARLLDALSFMPSRNGKLRLMADYLSAIESPADRADRGWAMAALTGELRLAAAKPAMIRALVGERTDPALFAWSYDYVGDLAETVALIWPTTEPTERPPRLGEVIAALETTPRPRLPALVAGWLDSMDATERWALLKLITGGLRVGVSARLAKTALAGAHDRPIEEIEELWHAHRPPYEPILAWLAGAAARPDVSESAAFRPMMLAHALDEGADLPKLDPADYLAEWKWDGIRVQLACRSGTTRVYSRTGDDVGGAFPEIVAALADEAVVDGELLVGRRQGDGWAVGSFNDLQQRLNRKQADPKLLREAPAFVRLYDILIEGADDLRALPLVARRERLEAWHGRRLRPHFDLSPLIPFADWEALAAIRAAAREQGIEGLMLKRRDSPYLAGRPKGPWFKWKRDALTVDAVLMYAQRGHGKRSSFYSDYTFGCWRTGEDGAQELVPVGKAYFGFTDEELRLLDKWVRDHTTNRFGPVR